MNKEVEPFPKYGDIIYCFFPNRDFLNKEDEGLPFLDPHYCLVLKTYKDTHSVLVAYGTSQRTNIKTNTDLIISHYSHLQESGLHKKTKFIFEQESIALIPYNEMYVSSKGISGVLPKVLHDEVRNIIKIIGSAKFIALVSALENNRIIISKKENDFFN